MRYWLMCVALALFAVAAGESGETKKKDKDKEKDVTKDPKTTMPTEPTEVAGKSFKAWMVEMKDQDPARREIAMKAILGFGPSKSYEAVPEILAQLKRHNPAASTGEAIDLSMRVNGVVALSTIFKATWGTKKEGPDTKHLDEAFIIYKKCLKDPQVIMRVRAVQGIMYLGPKAREAIDDIALLAKDPVTWEVRKEALQTLVFLGGPDGKGQGANPKVLTALRSVLNPPIGPPDRVYFVRQTAVQGLTALSHGTGKVPVELSTKALNDPSSEVRLTALNALAELKAELDDKENKDRPLIVKRLNTHALAEKDDIIFIWTHATIMTLTNVGKTHVDPIVKKLNDTKEVHIKLQALNVLGLGGKEAKPFALKAVLPYTEDKDPNIAWAAVITCMKMLDFDPVLGKLKDKATENRLQALDLISKAGPLAKSACYDDVKSAIGDTETTIGAAAIDTLANMHAFEALPALRAIAADKKANAALREAAKDAVDDLELVLKEKSKEKNKDKK